MKKKPFVGVWLDHREAFLFWADEEGDIETEYLKSDYQETSEPTERATGFAGGFAQGAVGPVFPHASVERRHMEQLKKYFKKLAAMLHDANQLYLFGHGMATKEFARFLGTRERLAERLQAVESFDRMTRPQMIARVKQFFRLP